MWTRFMDMSSGGGQKEAARYIYIEAQEEEAKLIFYNRFGHNPERTTCTCCGEDYSINEEKDLQQATAFERGCVFGYVNSDGHEVNENEAWVSGKGLNEGYSPHYFERKDPEGFSFNNYKSLEDYIKSDDIIIIYAKNITDNERIGVVPEQGYVWVD